MDAAKRERRFLEAVRLSGLVPQIEIDRAVAFQKFAHARGKPLPLDRILLRFQLLTEEQVAALYQALRYFLFRKEDKLYAKIAVKNQLLTERDMKRCLKEQKKAFRERRQLRRVNEIAFEKGLMSPKEDRALVAKLKELKPGLSLEPLNINGSRSGPARKGEEEEWRKEVRAREIQELQEASGIHDVPSSHTERFDSPDVPGEESSSNTAKFDDDLPELTASSPGKAPPPPPKAKKGQLSDDDLDPLWAEADLDEVELDSEQRSASKPGSSADDETDLF